MQSLFLKIFMVLFHFSLFTEMLKKDPQLVFLIGPSPIYQEHAEHVETVWLQHGRKTRNTFKASLQLSLIKEKRKEWINKQNTSGGFFLCI